MGQLAVVNAPSSFTFIWGIIKPWLSQETVDKVQILGAGYREELLRLVDEDALPSVLGGKCTCAGEVDGANGRESACHLSGAGPWLDGRVGWGPDAQRAGANGASTGAASVRTSSSGGSAYEDAQ